MSGVLHFSVTVSFLITKPYQLKAPELFHSDSEQETHMASLSPWIRAFPVFVARKGRIQVWQQWSPYLQLWKTLKPSSSHLSFRECSRGAKHLNMKVETLTQWLKMVLSKLHLIPCLTESLEPYLASSLWMGKKVWTPNSLYSSSRYDYDFYRPYWSFERDDY